MLFFVSIVPYTSIFSICSHSYVPYASIEIILFPCWFMHIFCSSCFHMFPICFILFPDASDRISVSMKFPYVCHYHVFPLCLPYFIGLVKGNNYRKALYVMVKTMVSCKFSLKPMNMCPSFCLIFAMKRVASGAARRAGGRSFAFAFAWVGDTWEGEGAKVFFGRKKLQCGAP